MDLGIPRPVVGTPDEKLILSAITGQAVACLMRSLVPVSSRLFVYATKMCHDEMHSNMHVDVHCIAAHSFEEEEIIPGFGFVNGFKDGKVCPKIPLPWNVVKVLRDMLPAEEDPHYLAVIIFGDVVLYHLMDKPLLKAMAARGSEDEVAASLVNNLAQGVAK